MSFKDGDFHTRYQSMGDEAESQFERLHPRKWVRYGLDRPPIQMWKLPPFIRYTPDYLCTDGLYEVQGCGQDGLIKVKLDKLEALRQWNTLCTTNMWLWDKTNRRYTTICVHDIVGGTHAFRKGQFNDGKEYWEIPIAWLGGWQDGA